MNQKRENISKIAIYFKKYEVKAVVGLRHRLWE